MSEPPSKCCKGCPYEFAGQLDRYPDPDHPDGPRDYCLNCWRDIGYGTKARPAPPAPPELDQS